MNAARSPNKFGEIPRFGIAFALSTALCLLATIWVWRAFVSGDSTNAGALGLLMGVAIFGPVAGFTFAFLLFGLQGGLIAIACLLNNSPGSSVVTSAAWTSLIGILGGLLPITLLVLALDKPAATLAVAIMALAGGASGAVATLVDRRLQRL